MAELEPPYKQYLSGKLPTHSSTQKIETHFKNLDKEACETILKAAGLLNERGKPTQKALETGYIDVCEKKILWNLESLETLYSKAGMKVSRQYANQEIKESNSTEPAWANLATISQYFNVTSVVIGKWLDALDLREPGGLPTKDAIDSGLAQIAEVNIGGKKTKQFGRWELHLTQKVLRDAGHPLDFDYKASLQGKGKNSDVSVTSLDSYVDEFTKKFVSMFNARDKNLRMFVKKTPQAIQKRAEEKLKKPGLITSGDYEKRLR